MAVEVGKYRELEVEVPKSKVTQEDIDKHIELILEQHPLLVYSDGPVKVGDTTIIDFEGFMDDKPFDGGKDEGYELEIGSNTFIPGFEEQMVGMKKGETRDLNVPFPENYMAEELAGKMSKFVVTVHDIYTKQASELNDEFVKNLNMQGVDNVEALKADTRKRLEQAAERQMKKDSIDAVNRALLKNSKANPDPVRVEQVLDGRMAQLENDFAQKGVTMDMYLQMVGMTKNQMRDSLRSEAEEKIKLTMVLDKVAELEDITASDDEVNQQYKALADYYGFQVEEIKNIIKAETLRQDIVEGKANELIYNSAVISYTDK